MAGQSPSILCRGSRGPPRLFAARSDAGQQLPLPRRNPKRWRWRWRWLWTQTGPMKVPSSNIKSTKVSAVPVGSCSSLGEKSTRTCTETKSQESRNEPSLSDNVFSVNAVTNANESTYTYEYTCTRVGATYSGTVLEWYRYQIPVLLWPSLFLFNILQCTR